MKHNDERPCRRHIAEIYPGHHRLEYGAAKWCTKAGKMSPIALAALTFTFIVLALTLSACSSGTRVFASNSDSGESAEARNSVEFQSEASKDLPQGSAQTASYTVCYTDGYGNDIAEKKKVENAPVGQEITEDALEIGGYKARESQQTFVLEAGENKRVVFSYDCEFILYDSDVTTYDEAELEKLSDFELFIVRNELMARHGMEFPDGYLQRYFSSTDWYRPSDQEKFDINDVEVANLASITAQERKRQSIFLEQAYLNQLDYNAAGSDAAVPAPRAGSSIAVGEDVVLSGTLKRRNYPSTETDMSWVAAVYWLLLDEPVELTIHYGEDDREGETYALYAINVNMIELPWEERDGLDETWSDEWDPYLNKHVTVSGEVIYTGNAHTFGKAKLNGKIVEAGDEVVASADRVSNEPEASSFATAPTDRKISDDPEAHIKPSSPMRTQLDQSYKVTGSTLETPYYRIDLPESFGVATFDVREGFCIYSKGRDAKRDWRYGCYVTVSALGDSFMVICFTDGYGFDGKIERRDLGETPLIPGWHVELGTTAVSDFGKRIDEIAEYIEVKDSLEGFSEGIDLDLMSDYFQVNRAINEHLASDPSLLEGVELPAMAVAQSVQDRGDGIFEVSFCICELNAGDFEEDESSFFNYSIQDMLLISSKPYPVASGVAALLAKDDGIDVKSCSVRSVSPERIDSRGTSDFHEGDLYDFADCVVNACALPSWALDTTNAEYLCALEFEDAEKRHIVVARIPRSVSIEELADALATNARYLPDFNKYCSIPLSHFVGVASIADEEEREFIDAVVRGMNSTRSQNTMEDGSVKEVEYVPAYYSFDALEME